MSNEFGSERKFVFLIQLSKKYIYISNSLKGETSPIVKNKDEEFLHEV